MNLQEAVELWEKCQAKPFPSESDCPDCPLYWREAWAHECICVHLSAAAHLLMKQAQPQPTEG